MDTGFLAYLADGGCLRGLAMLDEPFWQLPPVLRSDAYQRDVDGSFRAGAAIDNAAGRCLGYSPKSRAGHTRYPRET
jgi:hypothetical protein